MAQYVEDGRNVVCLEKPLVECDESSELVVVE